MTCIQRDPANFDLVYDNYVALLADADALRSRVEDLEHALKVCHSDANRALLSGIRGDYQDALLTIRLTADNAIG